MRQFEYKPQNYTFWQRYNKYFEIPSGMLIGLIAMSMIGGVLVTMIWWAERTQADTKPVSIAIVEGGLDDSGMGMARSEGGGGQDQVINDTQQFEPEQLEKISKMEDLPQIKEDMLKAMETDDPNAVIPISDAKAASYSMLDEALRKRMLGIGNDSGDGDGEDADKGNGPGGTGADSTRSRSIRWVLRFNTLSGRDYLNQLQALGATVLVPIPPENKQMFIFRDLAHPRPGSILTDTEWAVLKQQMQFSDVKQKSVDEVSKALNLEFTATSFWAIFPKGIENQLATLERNYRNRDPGDVAETVFEVSIRNGQYKLFVADQRAK